MAQQEKDILRDMIFTFEQHILKEGTQAIQYIPWQRRLPRTLEGLVNPRTEKEIIKYIRSYNTPSARFIATPDKLFVWTNDNNAGAIHDSVMDGENLHGTRKLAKGEFIYNAHTKQLRADVAGSTMMISIVANLQPSIFKKMKEEKRLHPGY